jgi:SAM-dependent methyltransferase
MLHDAPLDQTFDLVCAFEVLEHIEDDVAALKEWATHVRSGGSVVLSVPAWPDRFGPMDAMVGHFRRYTEASLREVMEQAGFVDVRTSLYGWPLAYVLEAGRNAIANRRHDTAAATMEERSAGSGRLFQPAALVGTLVRVATLPFVFLQRLQPRLGTGLVAVGRLP